MTDTYKITAVHGSKEWTPHQGGTNVDFTVEIDGLAGNHTLTQKKDGPHGQPQPGDEIFGSIVDGGVWPSGDAKPPKLKREQQGGYAGGGYSGGGGRPEDPERSRRIVRQHSQEMALRYATIRQQQGQLPESFSLDDLFVIADKFDADAGNGKL